jgi:hypothetical protein
MKSINPKITLSKQQNIDNYAKQVNKSKNE